METNKLLDDYNYLDKVLSEGALNARKISRKNLSELYALIGMIKR